MSISDVVVSKIIRNLYRFSTKKFWAGILSVNLLASVSMASDSLIDLLPAAHQVPAYSIKDKKLEGRWVAVCDRHDGTSTLAPVDLHSSGPSCDGSNTTCEDPIRL